MSNVRSNLGLENDIRVTNLRLNKRGQIQYSQDKGKSWNNIRSTDRWINLFAGPMDDIDGDGTSDNVLPTIEDLKDTIEKLETEGTVPPEELESIKADLETIEKQLDELANITPISDEQIDSLINSLQASMGV